jgi:4-hydroxythreonine-4-phosphate dehydrogenase
MPTDRPKLALTLGDCAGIGPELVLRALSSPSVRSCCQLLVHGNLELLRRVSDRSGIPVPDTFDVRERGRPQPASDRHILYDDAFADADTLGPGVVQTACGRKAYAWIAAATHDVRQGLADALVTAPINKESLHLAGVPFPGHTEILADLTGAPDPCMAFYSPGLFLSLATIHVALADVPRLLTVPRLLRTIRLTHDACRGFGTPAPKIGVLALNPHAGERGLFGEEEARVLVPALAQARAEGIDASGPLVPDTAFMWLAARKAPPPYNAYVALYHDQGLIPFKMVAFDTGVNVTLGLPIIRTSPDHGTAFDIAWQGKAQPDSLFSAIDLAARMAVSRPTAR